jgi:malonate-semialdehyde dehydrogenase (acetylating)/methylmalonate-semialdehyde dehydrogenase
VGLSSSADIERIVTTAHAAFPGWRATPAKERAQKLFNFRDILIRRLDEFGHRAAAEAGKTVAEGRAEILKGIEVVEFALSLQNLDSGGIMEVSRGVTCHYAREPLGVVAGIAPFNFPGMVPMWMFPIAIALGNCFVLKPSEKVPLTASFLAEAMREAGFPPGVFSLANGSREAVEALIDHPWVKAIGFVGSTPVARALYVRASTLGKRALCLGGAKNHVILVPDADEGVTVRGILDSFTGCAGQRCMAASLLLAVGQVDNLVEKVIERARGLTPGDRLGAIIDHASHIRISAIIGEAANEGAKIVLDGRNTPAPKGYEGGYWLGPTVIDHAKEGMACVETEIFGPVLTIMRFPSLTEALAKEARSPFGNATSVFTTSGKVAHHVASAATSGMIGINIGVPVPREPFSFGGTKDSKFGHGDITGEGALDFWSNQKKVTTKWSEQKDATWMS